MPHRLRSIEDHLKRLDLKFEQQQDGATTPPVRSREASDWREAVASPALDMGDGSNPVQVRLFGQREKGLGANWL